MSMIEMRYWIEVIKMAKSGDPQEAEHLRVENLLRQEQGRPSVEEELMEYARSQE